MTDNMEFIEQVAIVFNLHTNKIESTKQWYIKPVMIDKLSTTTTSVTGIKQFNIDNAHTYDIVYEELHSWLSSILNKSNWIFATNNRNIFEYDIITQLKYFNNIQM